MKLEHTDSSGDEISGENSSVENFEDKSRVFRWPTREMVLGWRGVIHHLTGFEKEEENVEDHGDGGWNFILSNWQRSRVKK